MAPTTPSPLARPGWWDRDAPAEEPSQDDDRAADPGQSAEDAEEGDGIRTKLTGLSSCCPSPMGTAWSESTSLP